MEAWDANIGGVEDQNGAVEGSVDQWWQIRITLMMSRNRIRIWVRILMNSRVRIRTIEVKSWSQIRIRIKVIRILNPD